MRTSTTVNVKKEGKEGEGVWLDHTSNI